MSRRSRRLSGGRTPVLALNFLGDTVSAAAQLLSVRAAAGRRSAHGGAARGRRWPAQRRGHRAHRRMGYARRRGLRRRAETFGRHGARQRTLRPRASGFLRRHQDGHAAADPRRSKGEAAADPSQRCGFHFRRGEHRRRRAPDPAAAEISLFRRRAGVLDLRQFRTGSRPPIPISTA